MITTLLKYMQPFTDIDINFRRTKHGLLISMWNHRETVREMIRETDSEEYIKLVLFDMLDYLGYTPDEVNAVDDVKLTN